MDPILREAFSRFFDGTPVSAEWYDSSIGEDDFRQTAVVTTDSGGKVVLKFAANDFTFPEKIRMWQRTVEEYRALGYYCPRILCDKTGGFPTLERQGHACVVHAEEFSKYRPLEDRAATEVETRHWDTRAYRTDIWTMSAKIAAKRLCYTDYPSAYCLFEPFSPSDQTDEVTENALEWKRTADALPETFGAQVDRIWRIWNDNRDSLKARYAALPTSVFQADLNPTNLLIDETGAFMGVYDFNLCGRDVFLNYLMRENFDDFEEEIASIRNALRIAAKHYPFSEAEKAAALPLYRCLKPLWFTRVDDLKEAGTDPERIRRCLDRVEHFLTADINFAGYME